MGYMTVITILNDGWDLIKKHPDEFIRAIEDGMHTHTRDTVSYHSVANFSSPVIVAKSMHADVPQLILAQYNSMTALNVPQNDTDTLQHFSNLQDNIIAAQSVINYAKVEIEEKAAEEILSDISRAGKTVKDMTDADIKAYADENAWAKEIGWPVNFVRLVRKHDARKGHDI